MLRKVSLLLLLTASFVTLYAGPVDPEPCWPPTDCIPVDSGVVLLVTAALLLGAKKIWNLTRKN